MMRKSSFILLIAFIIAASVLLPVPLTANLLIPNPSPRLRAPMPNLFPLTICSTRAGSTIKPGRPMAKRS